MASHPNLTAHRAKLGAPFITQHGIAAVPYVAAMVTLTFGVAPVVETAMPTPVPISYQAGGTVTVLDLATVAPPVMAGGTATAPVATGLTYRGGAIG